MKTKRIRLGQSVSVHTLARHFSFLSIITVNLSVIFYTNVFSVVKYGFRNVCAKNEQQSSVWKD